MVGLTGAGVPSGSRRRARARRAGTVAGFLSPWALGFVAFVAFPLASSLYHSFTDLDLLGEPSWVGLDNYRFMADGDPAFEQAVRNTLWMVVVALPFQLLVALGTAVLLARPRRGVTLHRTLVFLPSMAPVVAAALAFGYLLDPGIGPVNRLLGAVGLPEPLWFHDPAAAKPGLALLGLWAIGPTVVLFLAGMVQVPRTLYDVAATEGAGSWQRFRMVTLPMISPAVLFAGVVGVIGAFQSFSAAYVIATVASPSTADFILGAPQGSTRLYAIHLYQKAFRTFDMGYASAMAWVLLLVTLACVVVMLRGARRWVLDRSGT